MQPKESNMNSRLVRACIYGAGLCSVLLSFASPVHAGTLNPVVPEIDGSSISAGLGLLAAGVMFLRARSRR